MKAQGRSVKAMQREAINQMLDLADEFEINPLEVKKYRQVGEAGSKADDLIKLMKKADFPGSEIKGRMKSMPAEKLGRTIPVLGQALTAWAVINFVADPAGALANELDISREAAQFILDGQVAVRLDGLWNPDQEVDTVQLADGSWTSVGDYNYVWLRKNMNFGLPRLVWSKHMRVLEIRLTDTPGTARIRYDDGTPVGMWITANGSDTPDYEVMQRAVSYE